jgi:hypothetical protein
MKRIENSDIPDNIFKVIKPDRSNENENEGDDSSGSNSKSNDYFKVLKAGNFRRI